MIRYKTEFGFTIPDRKILVDDVRVRGIGRTEIPEDPILPPSQASPKAEKVRRRMQIINKLSNYLFLVSKSNSLF